MLWVVHLFVVCSVIQHRTVWTLGGSLASWVSASIPSIHRQPLKISHHHFLLSCHYWDSKFWFKAPRWLLKVWPFLICLKHSVPEFQHTPCAVPCLVYFLLPSHVAYCVVIIVTLRVLWLLPYHPPTYADIHVSFGYSCSSSNINVILTNLNDCNLGSPSHESSLSERQKGNLISNFNPQVS